MDRHIQGQTEGRWTVINHNSSSWALWAQVSIKADMLVTSIFLLAITFSTLPSTNFHFWVTVFFSTNVFSLDKSEIISFDKGLTHYQMTNFRLFQTERVCRWQFQIWRKWQKIIQTGRKHCGKRRNGSLRAISPFPTVFSKGLFPKGVKRCHCGGMG